MFVVGSVSKPDILKSSRYIPTHTENTREREQYQSRINVFRGGSQPIRGNNTHARVSQSPNHA